MDDATQIPSYFAFSSKHLSKAVVKTSCKLVKQWKHQWKREVQIAGKRTDQPNMENEGKRK